MQEVRRHMVHAMFCGNAIRVEHTDSSELFLDCFAVEKNDELAI